MSVVKAVSYHVESNRGELGWGKVPFTETKSLMYCIGYVRAMDSVYPSRPHRIAATFTDGTTSVFSETKGRAKPKVRERKGR